MATPITFECYSCRQVLRVGADKAGKKAKCIKCGAILTIPAEEVAEEIEQVDDLDVVEEPAAAPAGQEQDEDRSRRRGPDEDDEDDRPRRRSRNEEDGDDRPRRRPLRAEEDEDRPRRRRSQDEDDADDDRPRRRGARHADDEDDDYPRRRRSRDDDRYRVREPGRPDWPKVRLGTLLAFIGVLVFAGGYAIEHIGVLMGTIANFSGGGGDLGTFITILMKIGLIVHTAGLATMTVGLVFWIFVKSNRGGALAFAIAAVAVAGTALIFAIVFRIAPAFSFRAVLPYGPVLAGDRFGNIIWPVLAQITLAASWIMMAIFLMALAKKCRDRPLWGRCLLIVILCGCAAGWYLLGAPALGRAFWPPTSRGMLFVIWLLYWIGAVLTVLVLIWLILALRNARSNLQE